MASSNGSGIGLSLVIPVDVDRSPRTVRLSVAALHQPFGPAPPTIGPVRVRHAVVCRAGAGAYALAAAGRDVDPVTDVNATTAEAAREGADAAPVHPLSLVPAARQARHRRGSMNSNP